MAGIRRSLRKLQMYFRYRLHAIRGIHLLKAKANYDRAKRSWQAHIRQWEQWKKKCIDATCAGCGHFIQSCNCDHPATPEVIATLLRRIAKIHPRKGVSAVVHNENRSDGPVGYRVCGNASWDNTVRAAEENR